MSKIPTTNDAERTLLGRLSEIPDQWKRHYDLMPGSSARQEEALERWCAAGRVVIDGDPRYRYACAYRLADVTDANVRLAATNRRRRVTRIVREYDAACEGFAEVQAHIASLAPMLEQLACAIPDGDDGDARAAVHGTLNSIRAAANEYESADWRLRQAQQALRAEIDTYGDLPEGMAPAAQGSGGDPLAGDA